MVIGWLAFFLLIFFSIFSFFQSGSITVEAWISLLLSPAALAFALNRSKWWESDTNRPSSILEEESMETVANKEVPNPEEDGFDIPVM
tara:strand:+ start:359 stop:622 length:264 start_codon:yes stop_codon:yes gene_type:complete